MSTLNNLDCKIIDKKVYIEAESLRQAISANANELYLRALEKETIPKYDIGVVNAYQDLAFNIFKVILESSPEVEEE